MENKKKKTVKLSKVIPMVCLGVIALVLALCLGLAIGRNSAPTDAKAPGMAIADAENYTGDRSYEEEPVEEKHTIDVPGYSTIHLRAGQTWQEVNFHNPEGNTCYFKMRLTLQDGTILWESDLLAPGKAFYDITLNTPLMEGTYENAMLEYSCFSINDQSPLNGAACVTVLVVS